MVEISTFWIAIIASSLGAAAITFYFVFRPHISFTKNRLLLLEREVALSHVREEYNERKLEEIMEALVALQESTDAQIRTLRRNIDDLIRLVGLRAGPYERESPRRYIELV